MNFVPLKSVHGGGIMIVNLDRVCSMSEATVTIEIPRRDLKPGEIYSVLKFDAGHTLEVRESNVAILRLLQSNGERRCIL